MIFASIDIGTNSVLLTVARLSPASKKLIPIHESQKITRLGKGIGKTEKLSPASIRRTVSAVKQFQKTAKRFRAEQIWTVGTHALRIATNRREFVTKLKRETGLAVEVISGKREAELGLKGALVGLKSLKRKVCLIDIGGGSTEVTLARNGRINRSKSFDFGAVSLTERFFPNGQYPEIGWGKMEVYLNKNWWGLPAADFEKRELVGIGGTVTTLAVLALKLKKYQSARVHGYWLSRSKVSRLLKRLKAMDLSQRRKFMAVDPGRADIIVAGAFILGSFMKKLGFGTIKVSDRGLRWGLIYDRLGLN